MKKITMQKITPFLWFDGKAEDAAKFYTSVFKNSKITHVSRYGDTGPAPKGTVMSASFQLEGLDFIALNGGPMFTFNPSVSFFINCKTQEEVDEYWNKLLEGGKPMQCGWLTDQFGLSWQVVPEILNELLQDKNPAKAGRVMAAMMKMVKIDIAGLEKAYKG